MVFKIMCSWHWLCERGQQASPQELFQRAHPTLQLSFYSARIFHKSCQFLCVAVGLTVHAAAVGLPVDAHILGKIYAGLPVRPEIPVEKGRSPFFLSQSFACGTYGLVGLVAGIEQAGKNMGTAKLSCLGKGSLHARGDTVVAPLGRRVPSLNCS